MSCYYTQDESGIYQQTDKRPDKNTVVLLGKSNGHKHKIGDGWHHIEDCYYIYRNNIWYFIQEDSTVPILYSAYMLCCALNLKQEFHKLVETELSEPWTEDDIEYAQQHSLNQLITTEDYELIMSDLEDINYHSFAKQLDKLVTPYLRQS